MSYQATTRQIARARLIPLLGLVYLLALALLTGCDTIWLTPQPTPTLLPTPTPVPVRLEFPINNNCDVATASSRLCYPIWTARVPIQSGMELTFKVHDTHCSSIRVHFQIDGQEVHVTDWLAAPGDPGPLANLPKGTDTIHLRPEAPGMHTLALQGEVQEGGCYQGQFWGWGGTLVLTTTIAPGE